ncbi:PrsW family intramembrane metalloprotease [Candidatus Gracilibacteria bacterium]|nr:PrsW family intramembrane metalloprotease [Candidatus Gracilibacteria bacterium]
MLGIPFLKLALISFLALLPILGWVYFFNKKHPTKRGYVILSFVAGMFSVLPIKLYERYWNIMVWKFEHFNLIHYLSDLAQMPTLSKFLAYFTMNILVVAGLFIFMVVVMFFLEVCSGDNTLRVFERKIGKAIESPLFFISIGGLCGIIAFFSSFSVNEKIWFFVVVGMLEEFIKHLVLRFSDEEKIRSVKDALEFSIIVALGFAFVENILYFGKNFAEISRSIQTFSILILLRSTISVAAHICFSAIFGYFYGVAKFSSRIYQQEQKERQHPIINRLHQVLHLKGATLFHEEQMMLGMLIAMGLHAIFNIFLEFGQIGFAFTFILGLFFVVLHLFHIKEQRFFPITNFNFK